ncbi:hypothetical protein L226DRAFT_567863 [Lentinus tigrinus ALCF2SS1-7]|uniref:uncharacterized protein n=1 Tax=Lentinus tigrinus ALCF2SS1-7 TaxID=1328758 RepID=UPI001166037D|nr:hypothetical protein L226DRAFT_567863 [Lentinus tigrinus ALCF2SS1-7]
MSKHQKKPSKPSLPLKNARHASAKRAAKKSMKARQRITKEQAADVTARINDEFAKVHMLNQKSAGIVPVPAMLVPEGTVQELADVMQAL